MNIYVGKLALSTNEDALKALFVEFGEIKSVKLINDRFTGRPAGYAFIEMPSNSEADQAIKALNGKRIEGHNIIVRPADSGGKKKKKKSFRRRGF